MREPWDYETFVRHYDAIAKEHSGWRFERDGYLSPEKLEARYRDSPSLYDSLYEFARVQFMMDQQV